MNHYWIPPEAVGLALTVFLSFLIGLEREEQRVRTQTYHFGGIRTYPLLGLSGFVLTKLFPQLPLAVLGGLLVIAPFLAISYHYKLTHEQGGFTSEMAGIIAYLSGALIGQEMYWIAVTVVILNVLLLQAKEGLEKLGHRIPPSEVNTFLRFLILTAVLLPIVPNESFTRFAINPYKTWIVVVAVSGISYGSYLLQLLLRSKESIWVAALLGGTYSSTLTTVVMAKRAKLHKENAVYPFAILAASSLMYARVAILIFFFSRPLFDVAGFYYILLALVGIGASYGGLRSTRKSGLQESGVAQTVENRNPLEFSTAFIFAILFVLILVATRYAASNFGSLGTYVLGVLMGFVDVDAFILSVAQGLSGGHDLSVAVMALVVVTTSNNIIKGTYAMLFGDRRTGMMSFVLLGLLSLGGLFLLVWG